MNLHRTYEDIQARATDFFRYVSNSLGRRLVYMVSLAVISFVSFKAYGTIPNEITRKTSVPGG